MLFIIVAPAQYLEPRRLLITLLMNKRINLITDVHWTPGMANQHFRSSGQILRGSVEKSTSLEVRDAWVQILALLFISFGTSGKWLHFLGCTFLVYKMDIVQCQVIVRLKERKRLLSTWHPVVSQVIVAFAFTWDMTVLSHSDRSQWTVQTSHAVRKVRSIIHGWSERLSEVLGFSLDSEEGLQIWWNSQAIHPLIPPSWHF